MQVLLGEKFKLEFKHYPTEDKNKIIDFIYHVQKFGMIGLPGKNKSSDDVSTNDPQWLSKVLYAQEHNLWHYHIGIPNYDKSNGIGKYTSEYILHYILGHNFIKIVDMTPHPPFILPSLTYLTDHR
ncbi:hypothetical protein KRX11_06580 [Pasteurellaceae bacterium TAE3-ERU1]|nr:hypothetical protein [Pasteurellaceae bacterium TAE3-ERU1]